MNHMRPSASLIVSAAAVIGILISDPLSAQTPPQVIKGRVAAVSSTDVTIDSQGTRLKVGLASDWLLFISAQTTIEAIKRGSFIGTTNVDTPGGGQAVEVHVFPPGSKFGEGQRLMDSATSTRMTNGTVQSAMRMTNGTVQPATRMTNGTVSQSTTASGGLDLTVTFSGGTRNVRVPADAKFTTLEPADRSVLKPGILVSMQASPGPDGKLSARVITTGPNGTAPAR